MSQGTVTAVTITTLLASSAVAYLAYFDYKRRNDAEFRKALRKNAREHKKQEDLKKTSEARKIENLVKKSLAEEPIPESINEKEKMFKSLLNQGDNLTKSESTYTEAALAFYKALHVYPNPAELLDMYDRSMPREMVDQILTMIKVVPPPAFARAFAAAAAGVD
ncbi:hypothetical protein CANCADRAFT_53407 [Tortispora caseinolytica NRRL Y-17796]|uniref:Mitochondrial import receptor subunit TOM20 n=1 Tax=Tortispora caseinolytica NRRL Y-17796 TaxID=767744 RepID=A0A1E4TBD7_9ASCO|nr:hypothetical protein CANCADRAFT_53407 [Tortispora caseinolytica NRRL Y-17796]